MRARFPAAGGSAIGRQPARLRAGLQTCRWRECFPPAAARPAPGSLISHLCGAEPEARPPVCLPEARPGSRYAGGVPSVEIPPPGPPGETPLPMFGMIRPLPGGD